MAQSIKNGHPFQSRQCSRLVTSGGFSRSLSNLRTGVLAVGMASSEQVARQSQRILAPTITGWGMTECGIPLLSFLDSSEDDRCAGSGYPLPGYDFKVIDSETGETLPPMETGELCVRGYGLMQGYYKKPEETAKAMDAEGWLHSGGGGGMTAGVMLGLEISGIGLPPNCFGNRQCVIAQPEGA